jgi:alginate O-acetyltransferase complex protein AlgI
MLFSSIPFLYYFLPLVLITYFAAPKKLKNAVLFVYSLVFYAWGEPLYVFLMAASITSAWGLALLMDKAKTQKARKILMIISVVISFSFLAYFKYADFFISNFNAATGLSIPLLKLALPVGISFYTFQIASYTIDVYRGDVAPQRSIISFGAYVTLFPQLIAGPIVRYSDVDAQLGERHHTLTDLGCGFRTFLCGLCKKVLLANAAGALWATMRDTPYELQSTVGAWFGVICFTAQIYFDFSGYSDMAIGLGRMLGFTFPENFYYPFTARSLTDYWRRWHITLSSWFREYVYIPLGGNRRGRGRTYLNLLVVWALTGLWHGASWNFVLWGLYFSCCLPWKRRFCFAGSTEPPASSDIFGRLCV